MLKAIRQTHTYRIVRKIADGGMGSVYLAVQDGAHGFTKTVAIKTLLPELSDDEKFVDMFVQEAKLVANLVHENIVQIYQLGQSDEGYYFVMEYVNGLSLQEFARYHVLTGKRIPLPLAVFISSRVARGLAYAHTRSDPLGKPLAIVHRDICPNNVLITTEGLPKLTDFGIAVRTSMLSPHARPELMGRLAFMPPEQARRQPVDFRADIYAMGAVVFELLAGATVREAETHEGMMQMAQDGFVRWDLLPPDLPDALVAIMRRCLAPAPADRYAATRELAHDLEYFIYKDGYGPTIQTLETYLRQEFPHLYEAGRKLVRQSTRLERETAKTLVEVPTATAIV